MCRVLGYCPQNEGVIFRLLRVEGSDFRTLGNRTHAVNGPEQRSGLTVQVFWLPRGLGFGCL